MENDFLGFAPAKTFLQLLTEFVSFFVRCERIIKGGKRGRIRILRLSGQLRVRHDLHDRFTQSLFSAFKEGNNVVVALTHLAAVQSRKDRGVFVDQCFGQRKDLLPVSVHLIESCRDISAHFNVLDLITADRNEISLENQNIRCHQDRIAKQAHGHVVVRIFACGFVGFYLCFIGMSSVHQAFGRHTVQNPVEFHRLRKIALTIKMHAFGIQSAGEPSRGNLNTALLNAIRIARLNQSMIVRQEVKTFRTFSPAFLDCRTNGADIVPQMKCAAGRHTG